MKHKYYVHIDPEYNSIGLSLNPNGDVLSEEGYLSHIILAENFDQAMQFHYDIQGWGTYKPME